MAKLEISTQTAEQLAQLSKQTQRTIDEVLLWLLNNYRHSLTSVDHASTEVESETWTEEELTELLKPKKTLTGKQIAEKGLLGSWEDEGIVDSLAWLEHQRNKRRNKFTW